MNNIICSVNSLKNGFMVYWKEIKNAACYHVHLIVGDTKKEYKIVKGQISVIKKKEEFLEIALVDIPRNIKYYSFINLPEIQYTKKPFYRTNDHETGKNFYVVVEAEDREGKIVAQSERLLAVVNEAEHQVGAYYGNPFGNY